VFPGRAAAVPARMPPENHDDRAFANLKKSFLGKPDKSGAGQIDPAIAPLCEVLNRRVDIFTTSSCSGRAVLWLGDEPPLKRRGTPALVRLHVSHDAARVPALLDEATAAIAAQRSEEVTMPAPTPHASALWLRFEPMALHVCCRDWDSAWALVVAARAAGLKRTAVSGPGPGPRSAVRSCRRVSGDGGGAAPGAWRVALEGAERLEMPLAVQGRPAYPLEEPGMREWLESTVLRKFERNAAKTQRLLNILITERSAGLPTVSDGGIGPTEGA